MLNLSFWKANIKGDVILDGMSESTGTNLTAAFRMAEHQFFFYVRDLHGIPPRERGEPDYYGLNVADT